MSRNQGFSRKLLIAVDAKGYGARTDSGQAILQTSLRSVLDAAASEAGLNRRSWECQMAGDGELSILPVSEPEPKVVDDFTRELAAELVHYNESRTPAFQLRLRLAVHFGAAMPADMGFTGQGIVQVSRLVDCAPVRSLLNDERVFLGTIVSDNVFQDVIAQGHTSLRAKDFAPVMVTNKEYAKRAWVRAPGWDIGGFQIAGQTPPADAPTPMAPASPASATSGPSRSIHTEFHAEVRAEQINIGGIA